MTLLSSSAYASDMAGIAILISFPITGVCLLASIIIALMSTTSKGYLYIFIAMIFGFIIAAFIGKYPWRLPSDIEMYHIHLIITLLLFVPPLTLK